MDNSIRLMTYNVLACTHPETLFTTFSMHKDDMDIICLQEVVAHKGVSQFVDELRHVLGSSWRVESFFDLDLSEDMGLVTAWKHTKFTFLSRQEFFLPEVTKYSLLETFIQRLVGLSHYVFKRKVFSVELSYKGQRISVTNVHLSLEGGPKQRLHQLQYLQHQIQTPAARHIICGDFNTLHFDGKLSQEQQKIQQILSDFDDATKDIAVTDDATQYTYPTLLNKLAYGTIHFLKIHLYQKLDYIWIKGFEASQVQTLDVDGSDHFPVIATLIPNNP